MEFITLSISGSDFIFNFISSAASAATKKTASSAGTYAYVTNSGDTTVSVSDPATNIVTVMLSMEK